MLNHRPDVLTYFVVVIVSLDLSKLFLRKHIQEFKHVLDKCGNTIFRNWVNQNSTTRKLRICIYVLVVLRRDERYNFIKSRTTKISETCLFVFLQQYITTSGHISTGFLNSDLSLNHACFLIIFFLRAVVIVAH